MSYPSSYRQQNDIFKYKKKLPIKSLQAAICNVALFKNMKQKQFRDTIYISYCEDGVILQAVNLNQWEKACDYVMDFLIDKKIALLTYGFDKQVYEQLIIKGLKQYTRRIKQQGEQCPYINIIHYQKLRKSCEYMDKQRYMDPLKYWQHKFKINPNFSFLIVEPKQKFYQVKRYLLQVLLKRQVTLKIQYLSLWQFLYLLYSSKNKDQIRELCEKKILQVQIIKKKQVQEQTKRDNKIKSFKKEEELQASKQDDKFSLMKILNESQFVVKIVNFSDLVLNQYEVKIIKHTSNLGKLGLEYVSAKQIEKQIKSVSKYIRAPQASQQPSGPVIVNTSIKKQPSITQIYETLHGQIIQQIKKQNSSSPQNSQEYMYSMIPYKRCEKQKYLNLLDKLLKTASQIKNKNLEQIHGQLKKLQICQYDQIEFLSILPLQKNNQNISPQLKAKAIQQKSYHMYKVSINDCPYMVVEYHQVPIDDLDTFILYLQQLKTYYCTYMVRFYGISIRYGQNIHQSHAQILSKQNPSLLHKIQSSQSHTYKQVSKSKLQQYSYYLVFDYHHRNLQSLIQNDLILDNLQIANMSLQILYLCQYLHSHDQPRCLGTISLEQTFWPFTVILPYLGQSTSKIENKQNKKNSQQHHKSIIPSPKKLSKFRYNCSQQGFQGDVKLVGKLMEHLMTAQNQQLDQNQQPKQNDEEIQYEEGTIDKELQTLWKQMIKQSKYDRITIAKAISTLEDILCV